MMIATVALLALLLGVSVVQLVATIFLTATVEDAFRSTENKNATVGETTLPNKENGLGG